MSGALDNKAIATASKLIKKFGDIITYKSISTEYNINTGGVDTVETTYNNIPAQISKPTLKDLQGTLVSVNDLIVNIASSDLIVTPKTGDLVVVDSVAYTVTGNIYIKGQKIIKHSLVCKVS